MRYEFFNVKHISVYPHIDYMLKVEIDVSFTSSDKIDVGDLVCFDGFDSGQRYLITEKVYMDDEGYYIRCKNSDGYRRDIFINEWSDSGVLTVTGNIKP